MTPDALARLHAAAFVQDRGWRADEFATLLASVHVRLHTAPHGFALSRTVAGETELLTLVVDPAFQRSGIGRVLLRAWLDAAGAQADTAFLEVASDNAGALALYGSEGFRQTGCRPAYYARRDGNAADALLMQRGLTQSQEPGSP